MAHLLAMLDDYSRFTESVKAAACYSYHHTDVNYIVPEGVIVPEPPLLVPQLRPGQRR